MRKLTEIYAFNILAVVMEECMGGFFWCLLV